MTDYLALPTYLGGVTKIKNYSTNSYVYTDKLNDWNQSDQITSDMFMWKQNKVIRSAVCLPDGEIKSILMLWTCTQLQLQLLDACLVVQQRNGSPQTISCFIYEHSWDYLIWSCGIKNNSYPRNKWKQILLWTGVLPSTMIYLFILLLWWWASLYVHWMLRFQLIYSLIEKGIFRNQDWLVKTREPGPNLANICCCFSYTVPTVLTCCSTSSVKRACISEWPRSCLHIVMQHWNS